jgi:hypothetical protein
VKNRDAGKAIIWSIFSQINQLTPAERDNLSDKLKKNDLLTSRPFGELQQQS